jgi:hypothetical protein
MILLLTYITSAYHHIIHKVKDLSTGKKTPSGREAAPAA